MYSGIVFQHLAYDYVASDKFRNILFRGFEEAGNVFFPSILQANLSLPFLTLKSSHLNTNYILWECTRSISWPDIKYSFFPIKLEKVLTKIINSPNLRSFPFHQSQIRDLVGDIIWGLQIPLTIICINMDNTERFADFDNPSWWKTSKWIEYENRIESNIGNEEIRRKSDFVYRNIKVIELNISDLENSHVNLIDLLDLNNSQEVYSTNGDELLYFPLENLYIKYVHIGVGPKASVGFVKDCIQGLMQRDRTFKVWVDAAVVPNVDEGQLNGAYKIWLERQPKNQVRPEGFYEHMFAQYELPHEYSKAMNHDEYRLAYNDTILSQPAYEPTENPTNFYHTYQLIAAYHAYLEYEGMVYDSMMAFNQPIPISEYQAKLSSSWRKSFEVSPTTTIDEALAVLDALIEQAKYQV